MGLTAYVAVNGFGNVTWPLAEVSCGQLRPVFFSARDDAAAYALILDDMARNGVALLYDEGEEGRDEYLAPHRALSLDEYNAERAALGRSDLDGIPA